MSNYYKLNLEGSIFWQPNITDGKKVYTQREYERKSNEELNHIYLREVSKNTYVEVYTNGLIRISENNRYGFLYPRGVIIDTYGLTPCRFTEVIESYKKIRKAELEKEYTSTIKDLLVNSNYCEYAKEKKESIKLKKVNLSIKK